MSKFWGRISLAVLLGMCAPLIVASHRAAAAAGPFTCQPGFYQVISGQLNVLNPLSGAYLAVGSPTATYNAMGYNVVDNYLYAMGTAAGNQGHLLRIANDGSVSDLGVPTGLPVASYIAGDFDNQGHLFLRASAATYYSINVATKAATAVSVVGANAGSDVVYISGVLYLAQNNTLYRVDLNTDIATSVPGVSGLPLIASFGAGWTDSQGELLLSDNGTGNIYRITGYSGATPAATLVVTGATTNNNDGASCANAQSTFSNPQAVNDSASTLVNTPVSIAAPGIITNDTGTSLTVTAHTNPTHGSVTVNADGSYTYTPAAGYVGADSFTYTVTDAFGRTSTATVSITVSTSIPVPSTGAALASAVGGGLLVCLGLIMVFMGLRRPERLRT